jgi:RHS repeat-associated protein
MDNGSGLYQYNHPDWLGSARLFSSASRVASAATSYAPFGEGYAGGIEWVQFTSTGNEWTVTPTGNNQGGSLDDFLFRRYSPSQGRWISPDPAGLAAVDPTNPQSWNRYAYALNNPLSFIDPSGLYCKWDPDANGSVTNDSTGDPDTGTQNQCEGLGGNWVPDNGVYTEAYLGPADPNLYTITVQSIGCPTGSCDDSGSGGSGGVGPDEDDALTISAAAPLPQPCRIVDPVFGALEFTVKLGPELQLGPLKAGASFYKNLMTGGTGAKAEANMALISVQADSPTPEGGSLNGGGPGNNQYSVSALGFQYSLNSGSLGFNPSKSFTLGAQFLLGGELSFNSDKYKQNVAANAACRAQGGS